MSLNRVKLFAIVLFALPLVGFVIFNTKPVGTFVKADEDIATVYKAKCAMCHTAKAEKFFDTAKTDDYHIDAILKGKKGEKPPNMPGFEAKGMTAEQAKALVEHMRTLRKPAE